MRLISLTLILWLCFAAVVVGARAYGSTRTEPNPLRELGFDVCEDQPCLKGIIPGVTTTEEALEIASKYFDVIVVSQGQSIRATIGKQEFFLFINSKTNRIELIMFNVLFNPEFPEFHGFIDLYGLPCAVSANRLDSINGVDLRYPNMILGLLKQEERLSLNGTLERVVLASTEAVISNCQYSESSVNSTRPWQGFASVERYKPE